MSLVAFIATQHNLGQILRFYFPK